MNSWRSGLRAFRVIALGQTVSMLGNEISGFALTIWAFEKTGTATALALVSFFYLLPLILTLPFAGAIVDRSNRKRMMLVSDAGAFVVTMALLALQLLGWLEVWQVLVGMVVVGVTQAFQGPAYASALATMVSKAEYPKASGALSLADGVRGLVGPALAAVLYPLIGLSGVLVVDALTFVAAFGTLLFVKVPQPPVETAAVKREGWLERASFGFRYILARPSLFGLMLANALFNFAFGIAQALQPALILARGSEGGEAALAAVRTAAGAGGILSGLALSAWGAPKRRINGFLGGMLLYALGLMLTGIGQNVWPWVLASLTMAAMHPLIGASSGAIWQAKVAPALQGRVLAARQRLGFISSPLGTLLAGLIGDRLLTPGMNPGGRLEGTFGWIVGNGVGAGSRWGC